MADTENSIQENGIPVLTMTVSPSEEVQWPVDDTLTISGEAADAKATGDAIADLAADISDLEDEIDGIRTATGSLSDIYPVGAIFATTNSALPAVIAALGTWQEIRIPMTWGDIKNGTRSYEGIAENDTTASGTVHFWLRKE